MMEGQKISLERQWILDRLETLSVKEQTQLGAAIISRGQLTALSEKTGQERELAVLKMDTNTAKDAVNLLLSLPDYEVICPAGSYEQLGESYLRYEAGRISSLTPTWSRSDGTMRTATRGSSWETASWCSPGRNLNRSMTARI